MEQQTAEPTDAFDAAISGESTYREPVSDPDSGDVNDAKPAATEPPPETEPAAKVEEKEPEAKPKAGKPRHDPEARISQAIARQREAERRAEEAERRARELETARPVVREPERQPEAQAPTEFPDFATWLAQDPKRQEAKDPLSAYMQAHYRWNRDIEIAQERAQRETEQIETSFRTRAGKFSEAYAKAVEADAELPQRIDQSLLTVRPFSNLTPADKELIRQIPNPAERDLVAFKCFLADQWLESEHPVELLAHLSDPHVFQRLATLPPNLVIRELAKVEAGFTAAQTKESRGPAAPIASHARPPIKPLGTTPQVPETDDSESDDLDSYIRRANAADRKAGRWG